LLFKNKEPIGVTVGLPSLSTEARET